MMEAWFDIGGCVVHVAAQDGVLEYNGSNLNSFCTQGSSWDHDLNIKIVDDLPEPKGELVFQSAERRVFAWNGHVLTFLYGTDGPYMTMDRVNNRTEVMASSAAMGGVIHSKSILRAMEVEHLMVETGALLFHSSFVSRNGQAILFTAPSGVGKSTQAELWRRYRGAGIVNGDRSVIRQTSEGFLACGIPFCGSSNICEPGRLPLSAIVVLSQAKENRIQRLRGVPAFRVLWEGCSIHNWSRRDVERGTRLVSDLIRQVPVYHLACTPDEGAVAALESALREQR